MDCPLLSESLRKQLPALSIYHVFGDACNYTNLDYSRVEVAADTKKQK